ncbi:hypothetical protein LEN26_008201 [Aphanomyces euteiches]|nr:hypothetical protein AeMF1_012620 [Aphanomyces euteiches]KAH9130780.1 hypothetical protein LEN26_008201 [Aphanomyces euteiches]KAH9187678.1 hypothetical protein AeNC1_010346 [Aphanomyces euteiches]
MMFGLRVCSKDGKDEVTAVQCLFCAVYGREESDAGGQLPKRKRHNRSIKIFQAPFRPENYRHHLSTQHTKRWNEYQTLSIESKTIYFGPSTTPTPPKLKQKSIAPPPYEPARFQSDIATNLYFSTEACREVKMLRETLDEQYFDVVDMLTDPTKARAFLVVAMEDRLGWVLWKLRQR